MRTRQRVQIFFSRSLGNFVKYVRLYCKNTLVHFLGKSKVLNNHLNKDKISASTMQFGNPLLNISSLVSWKKIIQLKYMHNRIRNQII